MDENEDIADPVQEYVQSLDIHWNVAKERFGALKSLHSRINSSESVFLEKEDIPYLLLSLEIVVRQLEFNELLVLEKEEQEKEEERFIGPDIPDGWEVCKSGTANKRDRFWDETSGRYRLVSETEYLGKRAEEIPVVLIKEQKDSASLEKWLEEN